MQTLTLSRTQPKAANCHNAPNVDTHGLPLVVIVGSPNVGKSVLFNSLTGAYAAVSNYPGTTVEITRGKGKLICGEIGVMDTPGMYSLLPITEEERVARSILLNERPQLVLHVVDAKNLERMLPMTLQLIEAGLPLILVVNLMDEADRLGVQVDLPKLQASLGIPVVGTALGVGKGGKELRQVVSDYLGGTPSQTLPLQGEDERAKVGVQPSLKYPAPVQNALGVIHPLLIGHYGISPLTMALLILQSDQEAMKMVQEVDRTTYPAILQAVQQAQRQLHQPLTYVINHSQREAARTIVQSVLSAPEQRTLHFADRLSEIMIHPLTGVPILLLALFILYEFVGVLGAQILVGWLESRVFGGWINPWINGLIGHLIPWSWLRDLIGGDFGVITLGMRYAFAIVLPIVGTFFLAFSVIEDSGYLPRLAMLIDRIFKQLGLNGRAVIPLVLGFGCDTMATIVTRTLETPRERFLSTLLLSLAIPCSAQLGVMLGLLNGRMDLLIIWAVVIGSVFLLVGWLAAKLTPGQKPVFYMELPPLRLPTIRNVLVKTYTRMEWYLREVFPLFIAASLIIWFGRLSGLFDLAVKALTPMVRWIGLPDQAAMAFLFGFFRRDYGAAGLYDMRNLMTPAQVVVAAVTMTLFVPCVAQFAVTVKERGWKTATGMALFIFPFALGVGALLNLALRFLGYS